jgi:diguanylate cyclase
MEISMRKLPIGLALDNPLVGRNRSAVVRPVLGMQAERFSLEQRKLQFKAEQNPIACELVDHLIDLIRRTRELETLAYTDQLTEMGNRSWILEVARAELDRHARYQHPLALCIIDADRFKTINQIHHLPGGDHALKALAGVLKATIRDADTAGRIGGEEFLVVAPDTDARQAAAFGKRTCAAIANKLIAYRGKRIDLTVSIGVAVAHSTTDLKLEDLLYAAASALATAKASGRNCCKVRTVT